MSNKNSFMTGVTDMLFLSMLARQDCYVYEITRSVEAQSGGLLVISPNTIYTSAYKLEQEGMISEYSRLVGKKRTRVYYHLEPAGRERLALLTRQYGQVTQGILQFFQSLPPIEAEAQP